VSKFLIITLLLDWSDQIVYHSNCSRDVLVFTDGKPWKCVGLAEVLQQKPLEGLLVEKTTT
jgi:hypothetical protein